jgi:hypothetical protein
MSSKLVRYIVAIKLGESYYLWAEMTPKYAFTGDRKHIRIRVFRDDKKLNEEIDKLVVNKREAPNKCILLEITGSTEKELEANLVNAISDLTGSFSIDTVDIGLFGSNYYQAGWYIRNKENIDKYKKEVYNAY